MSKGEAEASLDVEDENDTFVKSKKPPETKFCQQRLPAWRPMVTAKTVFPYFLTAGIIMIILGAVMLWTSNNVAEFVFDYTDCKDKNNIQRTCSSVIGNSLADAKCDCSIEFELQEDFIGATYLYYGLTNFYQNHRHYVRSRDDSQLHGDVQTTLDEQCEPYRQSGGKNIAPCGAVANSLFTDKFLLFENKTQAVSMRKDGIAWATDVDKKFGKPPASSWQNVVKPINWTETALNRSANAYSGDEELLVWMRPAPLPTFRKLHRRIPQGLKKGKYQMDITYNYPVQMFQGTKSFIISTSSWIGGKNPRIGIAYIVIGCIHIVAGIIFFCLYIKYGQRIALKARQESQNLRT